MLIIDPADWHMGEWPLVSSVPQTTAREPARPKARPAPGKLPPAQAAAIASINERYRSDLNDEVGF